METTGATHKAVTGISKLKDVKSRIGGCARKLPTSHEYDQGRKGEIERDCDIWPPSKWDAHKGRFMQR